MKKLSTREQVLIVCLIIVVVVSGYVLFFNMPISNQIENLKNQILSQQNINDQLDEKLVRQKVMLKELSNKETNFNYMPQYDNIQAIMVDLHSILTDSEEYAITFQSGASEDNIFRRRVTIPFTCSSYAQTWQILKRLHDSPLRVLLTDLQFSQRENEKITTTVVMTFFEYQKDNLN